MARSQYGRKATKVLRPPLIEFRAEKRGRTDKSTKVKWDLAFVHAANPATSAYSDLLVRPLLSEAFEFGCTHRSDRGLVTHRRLALPAPGRSKARQSRPQVLPQ